MRSACGAVCAGSTAWTLPFSQGSQSCETQAKPTINPKAEKKLKMQQQKHMETQTHISMLLHRRPIAATGNKSHAEEIPPLTRTCRARTEEKLLSGAKHGATSGTRGPCVLHNLGPWRPLQRVRPKHLGSNAMGQWIPQTPGILRSSLAVWT